MRNFFLLLPLVAVLTAPALHSQSAGDPNEGVRIVPSTTPDHYLFSWWGRQGRFYVIQHSTDLRSAWSHIPAIEPGYGEVAQWGFATNADMFFLRLIYTDDPLTGAFHGDDDGDGIANGVEVLLGYSAVTANGNSDGDLLTDRQELALGLDPDDPADAVDADGDGVVDAIERLHGLSTSGTTDLDGDSMNDEWELKYYLDLHIDDSGLDPDDDGLTNLQEFNQGTNPRAFDTDGDTLPDGLEVASGLDPLTADPVDARNHYAMGLDFPMPAQETRFSDRVSEVGDAFAAIDANGQMYVKGVNSNGRFGLGTSGETLAELVPSGFGPSRFVSVGPSTIHSVRPDGTVEAAGLSREIGNGDDSFGFTTTPETLQGFSGVGAIAGDPFSKQLLSQGRLYAWGTGLDNILLSNFRGDGDTFTDEFSPVGPLKGLAGISRYFTDASGSGSGASAVILDDGQVRMFGYNRSQVLTVEEGSSFLTFFETRTPVRQSVPVAGIPPIHEMGIRSGTALALDAGGGLWTWGAFNARGGAAQRVPAEFPSPAVARAVALSVENFEFQGNPANRILAYFLAEDGYAYRFHTVSDEDLRLPETEDDLRFVLRRLDLPFRAVALAAGSDAILLLSESGDIYRFSEPLAGEVLEKLEVPDFADGIDSNGDGLSDLLKRFLGLNPGGEDTNGDGVPDLDALRLGLDMRDWDTDGDGIPNAVEIAKGLDPNSGDSDGDGMPDNEEFYMKDRRSNHVPTSEPDSAGPEILLVSPGSATAL